MTRLTEEIVERISISSDSIDDLLTEHTGMNLLELACDAVGIKADLLETSVKVGIVPMSSGMGIVKGFSELVAKIVNKLGMEAFVTVETDVTGFAEAICASAEVIFMADDTMFIAYNTRTKRYYNASFSTAAGYVSALKGAADGLKDKDVLIIGAGRVGSAAAEIMAKMSAKVSVYDIDEKKTFELQRRFDIKPVFDLNESIKEHTLIFNASPASIGGKYLKEGSIISSPGLPCAYDEECIRKSKVIIHDVVSIAVAVMAVQSAGLSRKT